MTGLLLITLVLWFGGSQGSNSTIETCRNVQTVNQNDLGKALEDLRQQFASLQAKFQALEVENRFLKAKVLQAVKCPPLLPVNYKGHCYGLFNYKLTFNQAQSHCRFFDSNLVWIESRSEQQFLTSTFSPRKISIWIGCNDLNREGRFVWIHNKQPITFSNWTPREPNNHRNEDCCMMGFSDGHHGAGQWNDWHCNDSSRVAHFICKK